MSCGTSALARHPEPSEGSPIATSVRDRGEEDNELPEHELTASRSGFGPLASLRVTTLPASPLTRLPPVKFLLFSAFGSILHP